MIAGWELAQVEFKSKRVLASEGGRRTIAAALTSLANRHGGWLVIGVDDATHEIEAGEMAQKEKLAETIASLNRDLCSPPIEIVHEFPGG